jgi:uncharacterized membrane protein YgcG
MGAARSDSCERISAAKLCSENCVARSPPGRGFCAPLHTTNSYVDDIFAIATGSSHWRQLPANESCQKQHMVDTVIMLACAVAHIFVHACMRACVHARAAAAVGINARMHARGGRAAGVSQHRLGGPRCIPALQPLPPRRRPPHLHLLLSRPPPRRPALAPRPPRRAQRRWRGGGGGGGGGAAAGGGRARPGPGPVVRGGAGAVQPARA